MKSPIVHFQYNSCRKINNALLVPFQLRNAEDLLTPSQFLSVRSWDEPLPGHRQRDAAKPPTISAADSCLESFRYRKTSSDLLLLNVMVLRYHLNPIKFCNISACCFFLCYLYRIQQGLQYIKTSGSETIFRSAFQVYFINLICGFLLFLQFDMS